MTFDEYVRAVDRGEYPEDPHVPLDPPVSTAAGKLWNIAFGKFEGAALIESHRDTIRSNHSHLTDWHYLAVLSGRLDYYWKRQGKWRGAEWVSGDSIANKYTFETGDVFFTPPQVEHALYFHEHTVLVSLSRNARRHHEHEADLVRVELIKMGDDGVVVCR